MLKRFLAASTLKIKNPPQQNTPIVNQSCMSFPLQYFKKWSSFTWKKNRGIDEGVLRRVPSRKLTYPTLGKGTSSSNMPFLGDMLVFRGVCTQNDSFANHQAHYFPTKKFRNKLPTSPGLSPSKQVPGCQAYNFPCCIKLWCGKGGPSIIKNSLTLRVMEVVVKQTPLNRWGLQVPGSFWKLCR